MDIAVPWLAMSACSVVPPAAGPGDMGRPAWALIFSCLSTHQVTGDPGAVLWLEEIRQEVGRANEDTSTAQRSKCLGWEWDVDAGAEVRGLGQERRRGLRRSPGNQVTSHPLSFNLGGKAGQNPNRRAAA